MTRKDLIGKRHDEPVAPQRQPQGEGNDEVARRLRAEQEAFADGPKRVERLAHEAAPDNQAQTRELKDAEGAGRAKAKG